MVVVEKPSSTMTMKHGPKRNAINVKNSGAAGGNGGKKIRFSSAFTDDGDEVALNVDAEPKKHPSATTLSAALKQKLDAQRQYGVIGSLALLLILFCLFLVDF